MMKEAYDDFYRYKRDKEANSTLYSVWKENKFEQIPSSDLRAGMLVEVKANQRVPADMILLHTKYFTH